MKASPSLNRILSRFGTLIALALLFIAFATLIPGFSRSANLMNILQQISLLAIISEGFTMALIVDELDLAFPGVASLAGVVSAGLLFKGISPLAAIALSLCIGLAFGLFTGFLVTGIGISSLIATLASGIIAGGTIYMYTGGLSFYGEMPASFLALGRGYIGPMPIVILLMAIVVIAAQVFISTTRAGAYLQATGQNTRAARLMGINTSAYKVLAFVLSGLGAAFTGILLTARLGSANPEGASGYMMDTFAAALLGMTVLSRGRANPFGTFIGALMIGIINNGMTLAGAPYYMQDIIKGVIIILSVALTALYSRDRR